MISYPKLTLRYSKELPELQVLSITHRIDFEVPKLRSFEKKTKKNDSTDGFEATLLKIGPKSIALPIAIGTVCSKMMLKMF